MPLRVSLPPAPVPYILGFSVSSVLCAAALAQLAPAPVAAIAVVFPGGSPLPAAWLR